MGYIPFRYGKGQFQQSKYKYTKDVKYRGEFSTTKLTPQQKIKLQRVLAQRTSAQIDKLLKDEEVEGKK